MTTAASYRATGIGVGFLMGRIPAFGQSMGMWVNIFSVWVIALDTQVGVERLNPSLLEMSHSFGAALLTK